MHDIVSRRCNKGFKKDLVQLCTKFEQQNLRKWLYKKESSYSNSYSKRDPKRGEEVQKENLRKNSPRA